VIYQTRGANSSRPSEIKISAGVNPLDYLRLPESVRGKYSAKTYRQESGTRTQEPVQGGEIIILPEDDSAPVIDSEFQPTVLDSVSRTNVDEVEVSH
jgi:hypothetical protein